MDSNLQSPAQPSFVVPRNLRVLILEDQTSEVELLTNTLRKSGFTVECISVATKSEYLAALDTLPDLILSDYTLPQFDGLQALDLLLQRELDVPFILISGAIGEQTAVEAIKRGADDYLLKDRLGRLGIAVTQALSNKRIRDERKQADQERTKMLHDLGERVNELSMMHRVFNLLQEDEQSDDELFQGFVELLPPGWPHPEIAAARLTIDSREFVSSGFQETVWQQSADFTTSHGQFGTIEVIYFAAPPITEYSSFVVEEHQQINTLAEMLRGCLERRQAKRMLTRDSQLLASVQDSTYVTNIDGIVTYWNTGATRLYGWTAEEMLGQPLVSRFPESERAWVATRFQERVAGSDWLGEFFDWRKDETRVWIDARVTRIIDGSGQFVGILTVSREITARKKSEDELREQQVLLSNAERIANVGSWEMDLQTRQLKWSEQTYRIFGLQKHEFACTFDSFHSRVHPHDQEHVLATLSDADSGGKIIDQEYRIRRPNGEERVLQERGEVAFDGRGKAIRRFGVVIDITEREQNLSALRKSEERFQLAVNGSTAGLWDWDLTTNDVYYAPRFKELLEYSDDEFPNVLSSFSEVLHPEDHDRVHFALAEAIAGRRQYSIEYRIRTKSGNYLWFSARGAVLQDEYGHPYRMAGSILEVTDQKKMEYDLQQSEQQQRLLVSQLEKEKSRLAEAQTVAKIGSWETDLTTLEVKWSDEVYRIFETEPSSFPLTHAHFLECVHPDDRQRVNDVFGQSLGIESMCKVEHRILLADGRIKWVEEVWQSFDNDNGSGKYAIGTCRDISEAKLAESRLSEHTRRLEAAAALAAAFTDQFVLTDALQACTFAMVNHLDAVTARIWTLDDHGTLLNLQARSGLPMPFSSRTIDLSEVPIGTIARDRKPFLATNITNFPGISDSRWVTRHGAYAIAGYPLLVEDRCVGVVELYLRNAPSQDLQTNLSIIASNLAANIDRKRAEENLHLLNEQLEAHVELRTAELLESSRRHETLLANLQGMAYRRRNNDKWTMEFVSEGCQELIGIAPQQLMNGDFEFLNLIHPEDLPFVTARYKAGLQGGVPFQIEYRVRLPDGQLKWVWSQARGVFAKDGTVEAIEGFISDVTTRKLRELREYNQSKLLRMLAADDSLDTCLATLATSVVTEDNALQCSIMLFDKSKERLLCQATANLPAAYTKAIYDSGIGLKTTPFGAAAQTKQLVIAQDLLTGSYDKDWLCEAEQAGIRSCWSAPILSVDNELLGTLDTYTNQTRTPNTIESDRIEWAAELARLAIQHTFAKQALVASESFNRATLDALPAHIAVVNSAGLIVATNQAWKGFAIANDTQCELVSEGRNYLEVCERAAATGDQDAFLVVPALREILAEKKELWSHEYPCDSPIEKRWFNVSLSRFHIEEEVHALVVHDNVTNIKQTEIQLRNAIEKAKQASQAKSEFLATMSHELRTPLNGILGMNELLLTTQLSNQQKQFVEASDSSGKLLSQLVNDVLDLAKIESGKFDLDFCDCELAKIIDDMLVTITPLAKQKGLSLDCQLAPELYAIVRCDDNRLRQILVNLLGNAMKFTDKGGIKIVGQQVALADSRAHIRFSVIDTGEGIPEARRHRLFKPFSQIDNSTTRRFGGTGLGLSICKQLVDLMGGEIGVESQVGVGSTFWFEIPLDIVKPATRSLRTPESKTPLEVASSEPSSHLDTITGHILVAEDNRINQLYICELLKHLGCTYVVVKNGEEVIAAIDSDRYDLILMDCQMPEMDGFAAAREIRKRELTGTVGGRIPIVALTANALKGDRERCLHAGMDDYLSKPVRANQLLSVLKIYL